MVVVYPAILTQTHDEKDTYLVEIPDIGGLTEGYGLQDAIDMARDYIGCHFLDAEREIPAASRIQDIDISKGTFAGDGDAIVTLVDMDIDAYRKRMDNKSVRRNITLPYWLNALAERERMNVSRVAQEALAERLGVTL